MKKYPGIEIGGTKLQIVSGNESAEIDQRFSYGADGIFFTHAVFGLALQ